MSQLKQQKVEKNFSILLGRAQIFEPYAHCEFDDIKTMKRDTFKKLVRENKKSSSEELTYWKRETIKNEKPPVYRTEATELPVLRETEHSPEENVI